MACKTASLCGGVWAELTRQHTRRLGSHRFGLYILKAYPHDLPSARLYGVHFKQVQKQCHKGSVQNRRL